MEFAVAALLAVVLAWSRLTAGFGHAPEWLAAPSKLALKGLPERYLAWLLTMQTWAGMRSNSAFGDIAAWKCCGVVAAAAAALIAPLWLVPPLCLAAFMAPDLAVMVLARRRQQEIRRALPQTLDLMVLCVDAGLGLDAALQRVVGETALAARALNDELTNLGRDVLLGMNRERAFRELYHRTGVDELKTFASALNQSSRLGLSISKVLRSQSEYLRTKQSQKAEERAHKLPIYMAFPLWFFIMPALMLTVLGPSLINFFQQVQPGLMR